jgi:hypothetical protein
MPSRRRILLCRLSFVLLAIVPTLGTCGWLVSRAFDRSPLAGPREALTASALAADLSRELGVVVQIDTLKLVESDAVPSSSPSHAAYILTGLRLLDAETGRPLAAAESATLTPTSGGSHLAMSLVQTDMDALPRLAHVLHERILCGPTASLRTALLEIRQLVIAGGDAPQTLVDLSLAVEATPAGPQVRLALRPAAAMPDRPRASLTLSRNRDVEPPATLIKLDTAGHDLPLALAAAIVPPFAPIARGEIASGVSFRGSAQFVPGPSAQGEASGTLVGSFRGLDLDRLVSERFPHQLSGRAELVVDQAIFSGGRLQSLGGRLLADRGGISPSLIAAACEHLALDTPLPPETLASDRLLPFAKLAIGFRLDGQTLEMAGLAGLRSEGALLAGPHGPLLTAPPAHRTAAVSLVRTLVPASEIQVPATRETSTLVNLFPAPDIVLPRSADRAAIHPSEQLATRPATHTEAAPALPPLRHTPTRLRASGPAESAPVLRPPGLR